MPSTEFDLPTDADDDQSDSEGMKSLRTALRKAQKEAATAAAERDALRTRVRAADVTDAFTAAGLSPKLAKFYDGELTKEAVAQWASENADVFGITPVDADASSDDPAPLTPDQQTAARVASAAAQGGSPEAKDLLAQLEGLLNDPDGFKKAVDLGLIQSAY